MKTRSVLLAVMLMAGFAVVSPGQILDGSGGRRPYGSYFDADIDSINLYNGNLMLDINLFTLPGRELSTGLRLTYNSQKWQPVDMLGFPSTLYLGGWRTFDPIGDSPVYGVEYAGCEQYDEITFFDYWNIYGNWIDGLGTRHLYSGQVQLYSPYSCMNSYPNGVNVPLNPSQADGSVLWTGNSFSPEVLRFKDGTQITFGGTPQVSTRNGNYLARNANGLPTQDTLGRTIGFVSTKGVSWPQYYKEYTIIDSGGVSRTYRLNYTDGYSVFNPLTQQWETRDDRLDSIVLPSDSGEPARVYSFEYVHDQGFLTKVTLPTGGYISYEYPSGDPHAPNNDYVTARHVSYDGSTIQASSYYARSSNDPLRDVYVATPGGFSEVHHFDTSGFEWETNWFESGVMKKRVTVTRNPDGSPGLVNTVLDEAVQKWTTSGYDPAGNLTLLDETDWGPMGVAPSPLRRIQKEYHYFNNPFGFQRLRSEVVSAWNNATGQYEVHSSVQYDYDGFSLQGTPSSVPNKSDVTGTRGNLTHITRWDNQGTPLVETMGYDDLGNVVWHRDPMGHPAYTSYEDSFTEGGSRNSFAYPTRVANELYTTEQMVYDYNTGLTKITIDARNLDTQFVYDQFGRPKQVKVPVPGGYLQTNTAYDDANPKVTVVTTTDGAGPLTSWTEFDRFFRPVRRTSDDPAGDVITETEYDLEGRILRTSSPHRQSEATAWTTFAYDVLGRLRQQTNPDQSAIVSTYWGNETTVTDEGQHVRKYKADGLGQLSQVEETPGVVTYYTYHLAGGLQTVNQSGLTRAFGYDQLGRLLWESHPESGTTSYQYDAASRMISRTQHARNITTYYEPDVLGRTLNITYSDGTPSVSYAYDQNGDIGFLTTMSDGAGITFFDFDEAGRLVAETRAFWDVPQLPTSYTYFNDGQLKTVTYPSGRRVEYAYQTRTNLLASIRTNLTSTTDLMGDYHYNAAGQIRTWTLANGVNSEQTYNDRNQLTAVFAQRYGTPLINLSYGYGGTNNNGRVRSRIDAISPDHSVNYGYDWAQRLESVNAMNGTWAIGWGFDVWGNRTSQVPSGTATSKVGSQNFSYYNNGNTAFGYDGGNVSYDGLHNYSYDAENRIWRADGGAVRYQYDGAGRRVKKIIGSATTYYVYGQVGLLSEFTTGTGTTQAAATDKLVYRVSEQTGTTVLLTRADGSVLEENRVLPYGEPWNPTGPDNEQKFTTYQRDAESGLDYAIARYYASRYGRFMTPDPGHVGADPNDPQSWNAFVYAGNDPINFVDPTGTIKDGRQCSDQEELEAQGLTCDYWRSLWELFLFAWQNSGGQRTETPAPTKPRIVVPKTDPKTAIQNWCKKVPDARVAGVSGGIGGIGAAVGSLELLINYNTGQVSGFAAGGIQLGWNGGVSGNLAHGYVWGIGNSNKNYSGGFTNFTGSYGLGGINYARSSTGLSGPSLSFGDGKVQAVSLLFGSSLTAVNGGISFTNYTQPLNMGKYWMLGSPQDLGLYLAKQVCRSLS